MQQWRHTKPDHLTHGTGDLSFVHKFFKKFSLEALILKPNEQSKFLKVYVNCVTRSALSAIYRNVQVATALKKPDGRLPG